MFSFSKDSLFGHIIASKGVCFLGLRFSAFRFWVCAEVCLHFYLEHFKVFRSFVSAGCSSSAERGDILVIFPYLFSEPLANKQNKSITAPEKPTTAAAATKEAATHIISVINAFWLSACRKLCVKVRGALGMFFRLCFPGSPVSRGILFSHFQWVHSTDL